MVIVFVVIVAVIVVAIVTVTAATMTYYLGGLGSLWLVKRKEV